MVFPTARRYWYIVILHQLTVSYAPVFLTFTQLNIHHPKIIPRNSRAIPPAFPARAGLHHPPAHPVTWRVGVVAFPSKISTCLPVSLGVLCVFLAGPSAGELKNGIVSPCDMLQNRDQMIKCSLLQRRNKAEKYDICHAHKDERKKEENTF